MGEQKWMDFVSDHPDGNSTHGMVRALDFYAKAAADRNNRLIARLPQRRREALRQARAAMTEAGAALITCDREINGGGTMYTLFYPSRSAAIEGFFYAVLSGRKLTATTDGETLAKARVKWREAMKKTDDVEDKASFALTLAKAEEKIDVAIKTLDRLQPSERGAAVTKLVEWLTPETDNLGTR